MVGNLRVFKACIQDFNWPAGAPRSPKALIDRDFVPNPTQGREAPLRIPTLVAARSRLILTLSSLPLLPPK